MSGQESESATSNRMLETAPSFSFPVSSAASDPSLIAVILNPHSSPQSRERASEVLYRRYLSRVRAVCFKMMGSRASDRAISIEDICQDIFLLAFSRLASFKGASQFSTWLVAIARNQCLVVKRAEWQVSNGSRNLVDISTQDRDGGWIDAMDSYESFAAEDPEYARRMAHLDVARLIEIYSPERHRDLCRMAFIDGLNEAELAEATGMPKGSIKSLVWRLKDKMRQGLASAESMQD